jgi:hypothetical protein
MLGIRRRRVVDVGVAVYYEGGLGFLQAFNPKWQGYSFPMRKLRATDFEPAVAAREAFREAVGFPLHRLEAVPLFFSEVERESQRTGRMTRYRYHGFEIRPDGDLLIAGEARPSAALTGPTGVPFGPACRLLFLSHGDFATADLLTWTARHVHAELVNNQHVAVAVVARQAPGGGREFLMVRNWNYGWFPPASRVRGEVEPRFQAQQGFRDDTGYTGQLVAGAARPITDRHHSPRFDCPRDFVFHLVPLTLPGVDLTRSDNELARAMARRGTHADWVPEAHLANPAAHGLSPTLAVIRDHL